MARGHPQVLPKWQCVLACVIFENFAFHSFKNSLPSLLPHLFGLHVLFVKKIDCCKFRCCKEENEKLPRCDQFVLILTIYELLHLLPNFFLSFQCPKVWLQRSLHQRLMQVSRRRRECLTLAAVPVATLKKTCRTLSIEMLLLSLSWLSPVLCFNFKNEELV